MATSRKQAAMDAVCHPETTTQLRAFRGRDAALGGAVAAPRPAPARSSLAGEVRRQAMDAISNVQTVAQIGAVKLAGGVALYAAHIRQQDTMRQQQRNVRTKQPERLGRDL